MNNNLPGYIDNAAIQMGSAQQMHHRSFNNQTNYQSNPYMPSQMNNAPCASYGPGTLNLASSHPVINIQSNPQPTYMYPPPVYNNPIYPPLVYVSGNSAPVCNLCHKSASSINRKRCGCAVITWSVCLLLFTGCLCWIPFVMDECYDHQLVCSNCMGVTTYIPSRHGC